MQFGALSTNQHNKDNVLEDLVTLTSKIINKMISQEKELDVFIVSDKNKIVEVIKWFPVYVCRSENDIEVLNKKIKTQNSDTIDVLL